jgi:hypothetical protein
MENSSPAPISDPATALRVAHDRQNFTLGLLGGFVAMLAGTALWVVITVVTNFQIGYMAIGIGLLVGLAVQKLGHGFETRFRALGAGLALLGCVLGNLFTGCELLAIESKVSFGQVVSGLTPTLAWAVLQVTFSPMDLFFYVLGATAGWKYAAIPVPVASAAPAAGSA